MKLHDNHSNLSPQVWAGHEEEERRRGTGAVCLCVVSQFGYGSANQKFQRIAEGVAIVKVQGRVAGGGVRHQETGK